MTRYFIWWWRTFIMPWLMWNELLLERRWGLKKDTGERKRKTDVSGKSEAGSEAGK